MEAYVPFPSPIVQYVIDAMQLYHEQNKFPDVSDFNEQINLVDCLECSLYIGFDDYLKYLSPTIAQNLTSIPDETIRKFPTFLIKMVVDLIPISLFDPDFIISHFGFEQLERRIQHSFSPKMSIFPFRVMTQYFESCPVDEENENRNINNRKDEIHNIFLGNRRIINQNEDEGNDNSQIDEEDSEIAFTEYKKHQVANTLMTYNYNQFSSSLFILSNCTSIEIKSLESLEFLRPIISSFEILKEIIINNCIKIPSTANISDFLLPTLVRLEISKTKLDPSHFKEIIEYANGNENLKTLSLRETNMGSAGCSLFVEAIEAGKLSNLKNLDIASNRTGGTATMELLRTITKSRPDLFKMQNEREAKRRLELMAPKSKFSKSRCGPSRQPENDIQLDPSATTIRLKLPSRAQPVVQPHSGLINAHLMQFQHQPSSVGQLQQNSQPQKQLQSGTGPLQQPNLVNLNLSSSVQNQQQPNLMNQQHPLTVNQQQSGASLMQPGLMNQAAQTQQSQAAKPLQLVAQNQPSQPSSMSQQSSASPVQQPNLMNQQQGSTAQNQQHPLMVTQQQSGTSLLQQPNLVNLNLSSPVQSQQQPNLMSQVAQTQQSQQPNLMSQVARPLQLVTQNQPMQPNSMNQQQTGAGLAQHSSSVSSLQLLLNQLRIQQAQQSQAKPLTQPQQHPNMQLHQSLLHQLFQQQQLQPPQPNQILIQQTPQIQQMPKPKPKPKEKPLEQQQSPSQDQQQQQQKQKEELSNVSPVPPPPPPPPFQLSLAGLSVDANFFAPSPDSISKLVEVPLRSVSLRGIHWDGESASLIGKALEVNEEVKFWDLSAQVVHQHSDPDLSPEIAQEILKNANDSIEALFFSNHSIQHINLSCIVHLQNLRALALTNSKLMDDSIDSIEPLLSHLSFLDLSDNLISFHSNNGSFLKSCVRSPTLKYLFLSGNDIGDNGGKIIFDEIKELEGKTAISTLRLRNCFLRHKSSDALLDLLATGNVNFAELDIGSNDMFHKVHDFQARNQNDENNDDNNNFNDTDEDDDDDILNGDDNDVFNINFETSFTDEIQDIGDEEQKELEKLGIRKSKIETFLVGANNVNRNAFTQLFDVIKGVKFLDLNDIATNCILGASKKMRGIIGLSICYSRIQSANHLITILQDTEAQDLWVVNSFSQRVLDGIMENYLMVPKLMSIHIGADLAEKKPKNPPIPVFIEEF